MSNVEDRQEKWGKGGKGVRRGREPEKGRGGLNEIDMTNT